MAAFIQTEKLKASDLPESMADWRSIVRFAATFDIASEPFEESIGWGAENALPGMSLPALRACIYTEWRRYNHRSDDPDAQTVSKVRCIIEWIREKLAIRETH